MYRPVSPNPQDMYRSTSPNPSAMYSGHASPNAALYRAASPSTNADLYSRAASPNPYQAMSPAPFHQSNSPYRVASPAPSQFHHSPSPSPTPTPMAAPGQYQAYRPPQDYDYFRTASPAPPLIHHISRQPSPPPQDDASSPPPPAPPPHRILHQQSRPVSPRPSHETDPNNGYTTPGGHSRDGQSSGMTPSPLRDAMADVMSSLHDMSSVAGRSSPAPGPESPNGIWSPDAFDLIHSRSAHQARAKSAMDMYRRETSPNRLANVQETQDSIPSLPPSRDGPPALDEYVARMDSRLRRTKSTGADLQTVGSGAQYDSRPTTAGSQSSSGSVRFSAQVPRSPSPRKSVYDLASRQQLRRTQTSRTNATSSSSGTNSTSTASTTSTQITSTTIMSGHSAGAFSATSAGSFARQTGISFHSSHATQPAPTPVADWTTNPFETAGVLGGLSAPKAKKSGFFRKMIDTAKT
ncbi:hypothetical protein KCU71_g21519, partial [Aureobasidium melanogenum]